ncbi:MAG: BrnT family toxin [Gemmatimonadota bacterium]|nr:BrnT family toxin [Gemmatimonadota bacterium]
MPLQFSWDGRKAAVKNRKHDISFSEAATAFRDPQSMTISDPDHSADEQRFLLIGRTCKQRLVVVAHVERGEITRIISARPAGRRERKTYEEGE